MVTMLTVSMLTMLAAPTVTMFTAAPHHNCVLAGHTNMLEDIVSQSCHLVHALTPCALPLFILLLHVYPISHCLQPAKYGRAAESIAQDKKSHTSVQS